MNSALIRQQRLLSLLLGSLFYAIYHGMVHFSDWCYLAVSTAVAAGVSAILLPLHRLLVRQLAARGPQWPAAGRCAGAASVAVLIFGLANLPVWSLHTWLGPGGTWPWGAAAVLVAVGGQLTPISSPKSGEAATSLFLKQSDVSA